MTLQNGIIEFIASLRRRGYSGKTLRAYEFDLDKFMHYAGDGGTALQDISRDIVRKWIDDCLRNGNSSRTVARKVATLKSFFKFLMEDDLLKDNPVENIAIPKTRKKLPVSLSQDEIRQLISAPSPEEADYLRNKAIMTLMYSTGMRVSEVVSLKISGISLENKSIRVEGKGAKERILPLTDSAHAAVLEYFSEREKTAPESVFPSAPAFTTRKGDPITVRMVQYMVQKYGHAAGISIHVHPHLIRHSIASHLVDEGCHIEAVRQTLGHEDLATTSIYLSTSSRFLSKEHRKFNPADRLLKADNT